MDIPAKFSETLKTVIIFAAFYCDRDIKSGGFIFRTILGFLRSVRTFHI